MSASVQLPPPAVIGAPISAAAFNQLRAAIKSCMIVNGIGVRVQRNTNGTILHVEKSPPVAGAGGPIVHPFKISDTTAEETLQCSVLYGQVNNEVPDNHETDLALTDDATNYIYLVVTLDTDGEITDLDIAINTTGTPDHDDDTAYKLIGRVICADGAVTKINQGLTHSLEFRTCDRVVEDDVVTDRGSYHFWGV